MGLFPKGKVQRTNGWNSYKELDSTEHKFMTFPLLAQSYWKPSLCSPRSIDIDMLQYEEAINEKQQISLANEVELPIFRHHSEKTS